MEIHETIFRDRPDARRETVVPAEPGYKVLTLRVEHGEVVRSEAEAEMASESFEPFWQPVVAWRVGDDGVEPVTPAGFDKHPVEVWHTEKPLKSGGLWCDMEVLPLDREAFAIEKPDGSVIGFYRWIEPPRVEPFEVTPYDGRDEWIEAMQDRINVFRFQPIPDFGEYENRAEA